MRALMLSLVLVFLVSAVAQAALPKTLEEFQVQVAEKAKDPKGAVTLWFSAIYIYLHRDKTLGQQCILEMDRYKDWDSRTFRLFRERLTQMPHIFNSYVKGTKPENRYEFNPDEFEIVFHGEINKKPYADKPEGDFVKLFVISSGADFPRSITLQRNSKGEYKIYEFSTIFVGIRAPLNPQAGDF